MNQDKIENKDGIIINKTSAEKIIIKSTVKDKSKESIKNDIDYNKLTSQLETLLKEYSIAEKDDINTKKAIENAIEYSKKKEDKKICAIIRKFFTTYVKDFAKVLGLNLLVEYITNACK